MEKKIKLLFLFAAYFVIGLTNVKATSNIFAEDFENGITDWQIIDKDGDGYNWTLHDKSDPNVPDSDDLAVNSGNFAISSSSYVNNYGPVNPDNYLVSPSIAIPSIGTSTLKWYAVAQDPGYPREKYSVYIYGGEEVLTSDNIQTLIGLPIFTETLTDTNKVMQERTIDLEDYQGKDVKVIFRHYDTSDMFRMNLDDVSVYTSANLITKIESNGTFTIDKTLAESGDTVTISSITPSIGYQLKEIKILKASDDLDITTTVNYNSTNKTFTMPNYAVKVNIVFEKIPYTITITGENVTINPTSPIDVVYGDNKEITITANLGYKLKSAKIDNVEQTLPLTNNKLTLTNIIKNTTIIIEVEEIIYNFDDDSKNQTYIIGTDTELPLIVENTNIDNFDKVYVNNGLLDQEFFEVKTGSIVVTLKDTYLKTLISGTYNLKVTTKDGGKAVTTFVIANSQVGLEDNPKTSDGIINSLLLVSISIIGILGCGLFLNKKKKYN